MNCEIAIEIIHTTAGELCPSGWLVRVAGEASIVAPLDDALRVALALASRLSREHGAAVAISLIDASGAVEVARYRALSVAGAAAGSA